MNKINYFKQYSLKELLVEPHMDILDKEEIERAFDILSVVALQCITIPIYVFANFHYQPSETFSINTIEGKLQ